jgi:hypothetical protein
MQRDYDLQQVEDALKKNRPGKFRDWKRQCLLLGLEYWGRCMADEGLGDDRDQFMRGWSPEEAVDSWFMSSGDELRLSSPWTRADHWLRKTKKAHESAPI